MKTKQLDPVVPALLAIGFFALFPLVIWSMSATPGKIQVGGPGPPGARRGQ